MTAHLEVVPAKPHAPPRIPRKRTTGYGVLRGTGSVCVNLPYFLIQRFYPCGNCAGENPGAPCLCQVLVPCGEGVFAEVPYNTKCKDRLNDLCRYYSMKIARCEVEIARYGGTITAALNTTGDHLRIGSMDDYIQAARLQVQQQVCSNRCVMAWCWFWVCVLV